MNWLWVMIIENTYITFDSGFNKILINSSNLCHVPEIKEKQKY